jgi:predicted acylesterase/phospholipase RssA
MRPSENLGVKPQEIGGISLALSGGGFRASLYHLGVIRFLYEAKLLTEVKEICSVSGGSILAVHLLQNWPNYTGTPADFARAASELITFVKSDLRGRLLRWWLFSFLTLKIPRWFCPTRWQRVKMLEAAYQKLYQNGDLSSLKGDPTSPRPQLHVLATSMATGQLVSFDYNGIRLHDQTGKAICTEPPTGHLKSAFAVAASSAFPPVFPPVLVNNSILGVNAKDWPMRHLLTDGGVFDNLAIRKSLWLAQERKERNEPPLGMLLISDAERPFDLSIEDDYRFILPRSTRASDLLMKRITEFERRELLQHSKKSKIKLLECRLQDYLQGRYTWHVEPSDIQTEVMNIRTDLDVFTDTEIDALVRQGYVGACQQWEKMYSQAKVVPPPSPAPLSWAPQKTGVIKDNSVLQRSGNVRARIWGFDAPTFSNIMLIMIYLVGLVFGAYGLWLLCHRSSAGMVNEVELAKLAIALDKKNDPNLTLGNYVIFTGYVARDNTHRHLEPFMDISKSRTERDQSVKVVFQAQREGSGIAGSTVKVVGRVAEDESGRWVIMDSVLNVIPDN